MHTFPVNLIMSVSMCNDLRLEINPIAVSNRVSNKMFLFLLLLFLTEKINTFIKFIDLFKFFVSSFNIWIPDRHTRQTYVTGTVISIPHYECAETCLWNACITVTNNTSCTVWEMQSKDLMNTSQYLILNIDCFRLSRLRLISEISFQSVVIIVL